MRTDLRLTSFFFVPLFTFQFLNVPSNNDKKTNFRLVIEIKNVKINSINCIRIDFNKTIRYIFTLVFLPVSFDFDCLEGKQK